MAEVNIRELRRRGGDVVDRAAAGERVVITRDGRAVAELRALVRAPLSAAALVDRFRQLPPIDAAAFRADLDSVADQSL